MKRTLPIRCPKQGRRLLRRARSLLDRIAVPARAHSGSDSTPVQDQPLSVPPSVAFTFRTDSAPDFSADVLDGPNLVARIIEHAQFRKIVDFFADNPSAQRSLMSANAQALLYCLIRILKPSDVIEIGIYHCGTSEAICRALAANGCGVLHAVEPFTATLAREIVRQWPNGIDRFIKIYDETSMQFFMRAEERNIKPSIVFIDGDHSVEFAHFDISVSARILNPSGFILIDNVAQPGPFLASKDFLAANPSWTVETSQLPPILKGYDRSRATVVGTDFAVLRAPPYHVVDGRPRSFGPVKWSSKFLTGVTLTFATPTNEDGVVSAQIILRGFGSELREKVFETNVRLSKGSLGVAIPSDGFALDRSFNSYSVESVLRWSGSQPLLLAEVPQLANSV